jgi:hypothetical protein
VQLKLKGKANQRKIYSAALPRCNNLMWECAYLTICYSLSPLLLSNSFIDFLLRMAQLLKVVLAIVLEKLLFESAFLKLQFLALPLVFLALLIPLGFLLENFRLPLLK